MSFLIKLNVKNSLGKSDNWFAFLQYSKMMKIKIGNNFPFDEFYQLFFSFITILSDNKVKNIRVLLLYDQKTISSVF